MFLYYIIFPSLFFYSFYVLERLFDITFEHNSWINIPKIINFLHILISYVITKVFDILYELIYLVYKLRIKIEQLFGKNNRPQEIEQITTQSFIAKDYKIVANNIGIEGILEYIKDGRHFIAPIRKMDEVNGLIEALKEMEINKEEIIMVEFIFTDSSNMIVENMLHFNKLIGQDGQFTRDIVENHFDYIDFVLKLYKIIPNEKTLQRVEIMMGNGEIKIFERNN